MIVKADEWIFDVDMTATMEYSAREAAEHCTCPNCRNFYAAVDRYYPELRPFLAKFGLDIEAPDRMSPLDYSMDDIAYDPMFYVFGEIRQPGIYEMSAGPANIVATPLEDTPDGRPCFQLDVYEVRLPWVLDEPFEGCVPAVPEKKGWLGRFFGRSS